MYDFIVYGEDTIESATSYISVESLKEIISKDYNINCENLDTTLDSDLEVMLINSTNILDNLFLYSLSKKDETQTLEFPLLNEIDISREIKTATAYICSKIIDNKLSDILISSSSAQTKKEKVDVIEKEYFETNNQKDNIFVLNPYLEILLKKYVANGSGFASVSLNRG